MGRRWGQANERFATVERQQSTALRGRTRDLDPRDRAAIWPAARAFGRS
ncbi:protein of unassigned function [Methylobacterium oryzae CBMB20]|uniref:Protein of unassigned function n=1 Tax=Methylobacterium oryzae CBMB20 TaxID=693986 RepID=A0A089NVT4_9HYPH|nr:protein of unassigned function [Methylobacterium oryzae CBMB20]